MALCAPARCDVDTPLCQLTQDADLCGIVETAPRVGFFHQTVSACEAELPDCGPWERALARPGSPQCDEVEPKPVVGVAGGGLETLLCTTNTATKPTATRNATMATT